jgi:hypothetical protein
MRFGSLDAGVSRTPHALSRLFAGNADHVSPGATVMSNRSLLGALISLLLITLPVRADVRYVDVDAPVSGSGNAWCDAFTDLQDALAIAQAGDEIRIAAGTYTPDQGTGDFLISFEIPNGVMLQGGYAGCGAGDPDERDPIANPTILSGDLNGDDGPDFSNYEDNSFIVVRTQQAGADTVLDGLIIERGNADGPMNQYDRGGGMYNWLGGPTLRNCTFRLNASTYGGAVYNDASDATFHNCTFEDNQAVIGGGVLFALQQHDDDSSSAVSSAIGPPTAEAARSTASTPNSTSINAPGSRTKQRTAAHCSGQATRARTHYLQQFHVERRHGRLSQQLPDSCVSRTATFESNTGRNSAAVQLSATEGLFV